MINFVKLSLLAVLASGSCRQQGVIYPSTACTNNATVCTNDRPYVCGGGVWRPVGDSTCSSVGGVCCLDSASQVHACVAQNRCGGQ